MQVGDKFKIDTYSVKQYEEKRVVSQVELLETPKPRAKLVLVYIESLQANCLVPIKELKK